MWNFKGNHRAQNMHFTALYFCLSITISLNCDVISLSETGPGWASKPLLRADLRFTHITTHDIAEWWAIFCQWNEIKSCNGISFSYAICHICPCSLYSNTTLFIHHKDIINKLPCLTCSKHPCQTLDNTSQETSWLGSYTDTSNYQWTLLLINKFILCIIKFGS